MEIVKDTVNLIISSGLSLHSWPRKHNSNNRMVGYNKRLRSRTRLLQGKTIGEFSAISLKKCLGCLLNAVVWQLDPFNVGMHKFHSPYGA